jgi:hypothetical protein
MKVIVIKNGRKWMWSKKILIGEFEGGNEDEPRLKRSGICVPRAGHVGSNQHRAKTRQVVEISNPARTLRSEKCGKAGRKVTKKYAPGPRESAQDRRPRIFEFLIPGRFQRRERVATRKIESELVHPQSWKKKPK